MYQRGSPMLTWLLALKLRWSWFPNDTYLHKKLLFQAIICVGLLYSLFHTISDWQCWIDCKYFSSCCQTWDPILKWPRCHKSCLLKRLWNHIDEKDTTLPLSLPLLSGQIGPPENPNLRWQWNLYLFHDFLQKDSLKQQTVMEPCKSASFWI